MRILLERLEDLAIGYELAAEAEEMKRKVDLDTESV